MWFWILIIVGGLVGLMLLFAIVAVLVGLRYDKQHVALRSIRVKQTAEAVWEVIRNHGNEPAWQPQLKSVRRLPDHDGHEVWEIQYKGAGNPPMTLETTESMPPTRLVRTIADAKQVFSGRWEFALTPGDGGTQVTITEHGEIPNPFFRGMFRMFANPAMYIEMYLKALAQKFGETAEFTASGAASA
jgi:uncharacterized membrane protein